MCSDCLEDFKKKFYCSECDRKKETEQQKKCNFCLGVEVHEPSLDMCVKCKTNNKYRDHNVCMNCILKQKKLEKCAHCNKTEAKENSDLCLACERQAQE